MTSKTYIIKTDNKLFEGDLTLGVSENEKLSRTRPFSGTVLFSSPTSSLAKRGDRVFFDKNNYTFLTEDVIIIEERFLKIVHEK